MFCGNCGAQIADGRRFCGKCGAALRGEAGDNGGGVAVQAPPVVAQTVAVETVAPPAVKKNRTMTYVILGVVLLIAAGAWWWFHRPPPEYKAQDPGIYPAPVLGVDGKTARVGFIDADGKSLIPADWDEIADGLVSGQLVYFNEGLCGVKKDGKWGFIDTSGHLAIPTQFDGANPFFDGLARVKLGNQFGYIDKTGQYAINPQFSEAGDFHGGLAAVHGDSGWGFINKAGAYVIKPHFGRADEDGFADGRAAVCDAKCGYVSPDGTMVIRQQFDEVQNFAEGLAAVRIENKWGFINTAGKIVINPQFDRVTPFSGDLSVVLIAGHAGTINKQGKFVVNPGQFDIQTVNGYLSPMNMQPVSTSDGIGLINRDGTWALKPSKAVTAAFATYGKVLYVAIGGNPAVVSPSGKVLAGPYKGAMLDTLAQDIQNESNAIQVVRAVVNAEAQYSAAYPAKGFAASLDKLEPLEGGIPDENHAGLLEVSFAGGVNQNYAFSIAIPEGTSTAGTNFNYMLTAKPAAGHFGRTFCADSSQKIHYASVGQDCTTSSPTIGD